MFHIEHKLPWLDKALSLLYGPMENREDSHPRVEQWTDETKVDFFLFSLKKLSIILVSVLYIKHLNRGVKTFYIHCAHRKEKTKRIIKTAVGADSHHK